jgi:putative ABC transport system permease protein
MLHAFRSLRRAPWYAATVIGVIAISIALSTTVFAITDGALFNPLPYTDASRLFATAHSRSRLPEPPRVFADVSPSLLHAWSAAVPDVKLTVLNRSDEPVGRYDRVLAGQVDAVFFDVIGLRPMLGGFAPDDFRAVQTIKPAVVTYKFWQQRFGGDASALGRVMTNETGVGIRIVGVLPADFVFPLRESPEILIPFVNVDPSSQIPYVKVLVRVGRARG